MRGILALPGYPDFPVEVECSGQLHAPFFTERRRNYPIQGCVAGNPGSLQAILDISFYPANDGLAQEVTPSERKL
jgi:hypothetical protein